MKRNNLGSDENTSDSSNVAQECKKQQTNVDSLHGNEVISMDSFANKTVELSQDSLKIIQNVVKQTLQNSFIQMQQNLQHQNIGGRNSNFEEEVIKFLKQLFEGSTWKDKDSGRLYWASNKIINTQLKSNDSLDTVVSQLQTLIEQQEKTIAEQSLIIQKQHESIVRFQNDVLYKSQKDLIMELIGIADQIKFTLIDQQVEQNYSLLLDSVQQLGEWVEGSLNAVAVRKFIEKDTDGKTLDRRRQEVVEVQTTLKVEEDGTLKSLLPGYIWAMPLVGSVETMQIDDGKARKFEFVIRPEQMARMKYEEILEEPLLDNSETMKATTDVVEVDIEVKKKKEREEEKAVVDVLDKIDTFQTVEALENSDGKVGDVQEQEIKDEQPKKKTGLWGISF